MRIQPLITMAGVFLALGPARADTFELAGGRTIEAHVVASGPSRLLVDGPEGLVFLEREAVLAHRADGRLVPAPAPDVPDPVGSIQTVEGPVRVLRRGQELAASVHGSLSILFDGDELRTGRYGRATVRLPGDVVAAARDDAIVRFGPDGPSVEVGVLRLEAMSGPARAVTPEGRLELVEGRAELERLRSRTRIVAMAGRAAFVSRAGFRLELPKSHAVDVRGLQGEEPASIAASNANAWPLRLEYGRLRVEIEPGERVLLLGAPAAAPEDFARAAPAPAPAPRLAPQPVAPAPVARVTQATATALFRPADGAVRRVDVAELTLLELAAGDAVETEAGDLVVEAGAARVELAAQSRLEVRGPERGPPLALAFGRARFVTGGRSTVGLPGGEVGLVSGALTARAVGNADAVARIELSLDRGTAGARFGDTVRAELVAPASVQADIARGRVGLRVPPGNRPMPLTLGGLDLVLPDGGQVEYARTGQVEEIELGHTRLLLAGGVRARLTEDRDGRALALDDGRRLALVPGTYRISQEGAQVTVAAPPGAEVAPVAGAPAPPPGEDPAGAEVRQHRLPGGVLLTTRGWGALAVKRTAPRGVVIDAGEGELVLAPGAQATLSREGNQVRLELADGRFMTHEQGAGAFLARVDEEGRLSLDIFTGELSRTVEVERGIDFDLAIRRDRNVLSYVFGQAVYVEAGRHLAVTHAAGLRTYLAADRGGR